MNIKTIFLAASLVAFPATSVFAQTTYGERHHIAARKGYQQSRIAQGDRSGQLTPHETAHLERQERGINREERGMRAQDNGHLTAQDRHTLARQQNVESARIYRDKHNAATDPGVPPR
ncbi:hypothetical protein SAMN05421819_3855 [Bryocella elongata]|uniref:Lipoprotein n=1 Tax=Bryocella elongata TaxID=863522 RepID=A0A1H6BML2_9BACT|nr:hypothetical protein [Bryocella elongata]SEG61948.1 hypothetical protein SAMN05421819_3855 [Bryocella elongata]